MTPSSFGHDHFSPLEINITGFIKALRAFWICVPAFMSTASMLAIDIRPADLYTQRFRIDSTTWEKEPLMIYYPTAVLPVGDDLFIRSGVGQTGQLWRYNKVTGKNTLFGEGTDFRYFGTQSIAVLNDEVFIMSGAASPSTIQTMAVNVETLETRTFEIPSLTTNPTLLMAGGNLVTLAATGGGVVVANSEGEIVANPGGLPGSTLRALALSTNGHVIGLASGGTVFDPYMELVEVDAEDGTINSLAIVRNSESIWGAIRFAPGPGGDYYIINRDRNNYTLHRLDGTTLALTEVALPEWMGLDLLSSIQLDFDGKLLIVAIDHRQTATDAGRIIFRLDPETGDVEIAVGHGGVSLPLGHMSPGYDQAIYYTASTGDRVLRLDLKTGGVTTVTSGNSEDAVIVRSFQVAAAREDIYVVASVGDHNALVQVDAATGKQTYLTELDGRLFIQQMIFDEATGDLLMTTWGGHPQGGFGTVMRIRPEPDALPEAVTLAPFTHNPRGISLAANGDLYVVVGPTQLVHVARATGEWGGVSNSELFRGALDLVILDDGKLAVTDGVAQSLFLVDSTTGETTQVISNLPAGPYLIRLPAFDEAPLEPRILSFEMAGSDLVFTIQSAPGSTYQLQSSAVTGGIEWTDLGDPVAGDGTVLEFRQQVSGANLMELFRIRIDPTG